MGKFIYKGYYLQKDAPVALGIFSAISGKTGGCIWGMGDGDFMHWVLAYSSKIPEM